MTIPYNAESLSGSWVGFPRLFLRYKGTILSGTLCGPMFWLTNLLHLALCFIGGRFDIKEKVDAANGTKVWEEWHPVDLIQVDWASTLVGMPLLFFFIVFYNNNSYNRFYQLYGHCVGMGGRCMEWTYLIKAHSLPEDRAGQWNSVRFVLAAMNILYYSLFGDDGSMDEDEWSVIMARNLLSVNEVSLLRAYKGFKPFLCLNWAADEAERLLSARMQAEAMRNPTAAAYGMEVRTQMLLHEFRAVAFDFRNHCGQIINTLKQPVPFPYFHLLNVMLLVQLLALAYVLASSDHAIPPVYSIPIMFLVSVVLIGMRGLAVKLANPFGTDDTDFDIEVYMRGAFTNAVAHLRDERKTWGGELPQGVKNPLLGSGDAHSVTSAETQYAWRAPAKVKSTKPPVEADPKPDKPQPLMQPPPTPLPMQQPMQPPMQPPPPHGYGYAPSGHPTYDYAHAAPVDPATGYVLTPAVSGLSPFSGGIPPPQSPLPRPHQLPRPAPLPRPQTLAAPSPHQQHQSGDLRL